MLKNIFKYYKNKLIVLYESNINDSLLLGLTILVKNVQVGILTK